MIHLYIIKLLEKSMSSFPFSALLSVYHKENAAYLDRALGSIEEQTLPPNEIVLVKDGPLTEALESVIEKHVTGSQIPYVLVDLKENRGLGEALNIGLSLCKNEWIARMDTDDIALPDRFERQFSYLAEHPETDLLGGWICEFDSEEEQGTKERRVPASHEEIMRFAKHRNPVNHMTVVCRKEAIQSAGGYLPIDGFEDYYLWIRMILNGSSFANIPAVLVNVRAGRSMINRRRGMNYIQDECRFQRLHWEKQFIGTVSFLKNCIVRIPVRLLPESLIYKVYSVLRYQGGTDS